MEKPLSLTLPRGLKGELDVNIATDEFIEAPIAAGQKLGTLTISKDGEVLAQRPLVALSSVEEAGFFGRLMGSIKMFFVKLFA